jgi:hypothetical protein
LIGQPDAVEQLQRARTPRLCRTPRQKIHRQHHVLDDGERRQELEELKDDANRGAAPGRQRPLRRLLNRTARHGDLAGRGTIDRADQIQQRRLPAARFSDDRRHLARRNGDVQIVEGSKRASRRVVGFSDASEFNHGGDDTEPVVN